MSLESLRLMKNSLAFLIPPKGDAHWRGVDCQFSRQSYVGSQCSTESQEEEVAKEDDEKVDPLPANPKVLKQSGSRIHETVNQSASHIRHFSDLENKKSFNRQETRSPPKNSRKSSVNDLDATCTLTLIKDNYKRTDDGILEMVNNKIIEKQKQVVGKIAKQLGASILTKKTVSLPVSILEPRSMLEQIAQTFVYAPVYLESVSKELNKLEQFKSAISFWIASLHTNVCLFKPFNPILGETYQGYIDNLPVYVEQVSHHPPVCCYQLVGEEFNIEGNYEFQGNTSTNSVKMKNFGFPKITFKNTDVKVVAHMPTFNVTGTMFGKKAYFLSNKLIATDLENQLYAEIEFSIDTGSWLKENKTPKDFFTGGIWRVTPSFIQKLKQDIQAKKETPTKFKPKEDAIEKIDDIEGLWTSNLRIGDKEYWGFGKECPSMLKSLKNPLASDSTLRKDIVNLKAGDEKTAQNHKEALEELQRKDKKLREKKK